MLESVKVNDGLPSSDWENITYPVDSRDPLVEGHTTQASPNKTSKINLPECLYMSIQNLE